MTPLSCSIQDLEGLCQERWPQIIYHCPADTDTAQRVLFCLHHAALCTSAELHNGLAPDTISDFIDRVRSFPAEQRDSAHKIASSLALFGDVASADTVRTSLTGPQLAFPFDVVVGGGGGRRDRDDDRAGPEISPSTIQALEQELDGLRERLLVVPGDCDESRPKIPDCTELISDLPRLLDSLRQFRDVFTSSLSSLLQSNAPLLHLQPSPVGEQLGSTAADLRPHLDTFKQLIESIRAIRHGLDQLKAKSASDSVPVLDPAHVTRLRSQVRILQTALGQHGHGHAP